MKLVKGAQSIAYDRAPYLISSASVVGKKEGAGPIGEMFDLMRHGRYGAKQIMEGTWIVSFHEAIQRLGAFLVLS